MHVAYVTYEEQFEPAVVADGWARAFGWDTSSGSTYADAVAAARRADVLVVDLLFRPPGGPARDRPWDDRDAFDLASELATDPDARARLVLASSRLEVPEVAARAEDGPFAATVRLPFSPLQIRDIVERVTAA